MSVSRDQCGQARMKSKRHNNLEQESLEMIRPEIGSGCEELSMSSLRHIGPLPRDQGGCEIREARVRTYRSPRVVRITSCPFVGEGSILRADSIIAVATYSCIAAKPLRIVYGRRDSDDQNEYKRILRGD